MATIDWKKLRNDYEKNGLTIAQLAEKHGVKEGTIKSQKSRDAKAGQPWKKATKEKVATKNERLQPSKKVASSDVPKKRSGNPNPQNQFAKRNDAAVKHGFFSKYLPPETMEIIEAMDEKTPGDLIWDQIQIQYAAIIRAQQIMHVTSKEEMIKELKREKVQTGKNPSQEVEYEFQFAWDRHAQLLTAQSRAISELRTSINQFIKLVDEADERRLKLEGMQLHIDKTKIEIDKLEQGGNENEPIQIQITSAKKKN